MQTNSRIFFAAFTSLLVIVFLLKSFAAARVVNSESFSTVKTGGEKRISGLNIKIAEPAAGELDATFNPIIDSAPGNVRAAVVQSDGKIIVGGFFKTLNGISRRGIARLNADNSIDQTFSANINGAIYAAALQSNGKIIVAGDFTAVNGANRNRIARLNQDGSLDATFNPGSGADNVVYDALVQPDGKILVAGSFSAVNSTNSYLIARLNADGSFDASFKSPFSLPLLPSLAALPNIIYSIALQANGKIVLSGTPTFTSISGGSSFILTAVTRLNADGSNDLAFNAASVNSTVEKVAVQPDDKILIGGTFTSVNGLSRRFIARLNADGSLDASFNPGAGGNLPIRSIFLRPDGKILIGGDFSTFNGIQTSRIARLNTDGSIDNTFVSTGGVFGTVQSVVSLPGGRVIAVGSFQVIFSGNRDSIAFFNDGGALDSSAVFATTATGGVRSIVPLPDGKIAVGGNFTRVNGVQRQSIARFNADGTLTAPTSSVGFVSSSSGTVNSIAVQPDGKILLGGQNIVIPVSSGTGNIYTFFGNLLRLNADGSPDETFTAAISPARQTINQIAVQPDGKIVVVWGYAQPGGFSSGSIARLNADGSLDNTFSAVIPALFLNSVIVQPDGKILIGGQFSFGTASSRTGSVSYNGVARLNADGSLDTTFAPATASTGGALTNVYAVALQPNGKILIGGSIYTAGRTTPTGAARLNADGTLDATFDSGAIAGLFDGARVEDILPLPSGKILIGGLFNRIGNVARSNLARLNADGTIDVSFDVSTDNVVYDLALQTDGKVLIGGDFDTVNGVTRTSAVRLTAEPDTIRRSMFDFDGDGKADVAVYRPSNGVWYLLNSSAGFSSVQFGVSTDKIVPADYDGDGKTDVAVWRNGNWFVLRSSSGFVSVQFGQPGDMPLPSDFDGDGKAELAVFRPSNGTWYTLNLANNAFASTQFGSSEDKPVAADYDADGKTDYAVYRPQNGTWYVLRSRDGFAAAQFGVATDKPAVGDYDADGKADYAVYRQSNGTWYLMQSARGFASIQFGLATDLPAAADYDADGKTDIAVFRPENGTWFQMKSAQGFGAVQFGSNGDKPAPGAFVP